MKKTLVWVVVVAIAAGGGGFFGGMKYAQTKSQINGQRFAQMRNGQNGTDNILGQNRARGSFATGEVISKDAQSVTIKIPNGGSKIVFYSASTEISKFASGASSDLEIGKTVSVTGSANSDGSITAQTIQIRPEIPLPSPSSSSSQQPK